jgi:hypothetical protein
MIETLTAYRNVEVENLDHNLTGNSRIVHKVSKHVRVLLLVALFGLLTACLPQWGDTTAATPTGAASQEISGTQSEENTPTLGESITQTASPQPPTATRTHAPDVDWREVPIMPEIGQHVLQIYAEGQRQGRSPNSFSVIGDCQSIPYVFMGPYGRGILEPDPAESYLWDAIAFFNPSFSRWSVTSRGGFTAASLLTSIQADPHYCKPGETPLTCEFRLQNPAYVFITLETWLDPATIDRYEFYLRAIVEDVINQGAIPILITKADAAEVNEGTHVINPAIVRVARDYDVPVVNFWRAAQYIDNAGIDPARDGFHLSPDGYDLKNTLALRALYSVWQTVSNSTVSQGSSTPTPTPDNSPANPADLGFVDPDCQGSCIFFGTAASRDGDVTSDGVYAYDYDSRHLTQILGAGFDLQDVSEDGHRLLVNRQQYLYVINLPYGSVDLVSDTFFWQGKQGAYWDSTDSQVIRIDQDQSFQTEAGGAINLFPSSRDGQIYFEAGTCSSKDYCQPAAVYRFDSDQTATPLALYDRPVFSPAGDLMAFLNPTAATRDNYYHIGYLLLEDPDESATSRRIVYFPEEGGFMIYPDVRTYAFSPEGDQLFIIYDIYSAYFERSTRLQTYLFDIASGVLYDFGRMDGLSGSLNPHLVWSPDGSIVLFFLGNQSEDDQFSIDIYQTDLESGEKLVPYDLGILTSADYLYITNLFWR